MKIEIEFDEVERLKEKIKMLEGGNKALQKKLKALDEDSLKSQAVELAEKMFDSVMARIFEELGFKRNNYMNVDISFKTLESHLGTNWVNSEAIEVEIGATVTSKYRAAFLKLGIKDPRK